MSAMQKFAAFAAVLPLVAGHGYITSPLPRQPGDNYESTCGQQPYYQQSSDINGNVQGILQVVGDDMTADCNLWLCKGFLLADTPSRVQSYTAGQSVDFEINIAAPHTGYANVSVVKTSSNTIIGTPLIEFDVYASNSGIPANNTAFSVTIPDDLGSDCSTAGDCVLQWFWNAPDIDQTYEGCVDFTVGGSSSGGSSETVVATSAAATSAAATSAAAASSSVAVVSSPAAAEETSVAVTSAQPVTQTAIFTTPAAEETPSAPSATPTDAAGDDEDDCDDEDDGDDTTGDDDEDDCDDEGDDTTDDGDDEDDCDDEEETTVESTATVTEASSPDVTVTEVEVGAQATTSAAVVSSAAAVTSAAAAQSSSASNSGKNNQGGSKVTVSHVTSYVTVTAKAHTVTAQPHTKYVTVTANAPACN